MREIRLPSLGAEMDEGTLLEWYVKPGDRVAYGDVIALLDTEKAEIEMESFEAGTIESLLIAPGDTVAVGVPIATIDETSAEGAAAKGAETSAEGAAARATSEAPSTTSDAPREDGSASKAAKAGGRPAPAPSPISPPPGDEARRPDAASERVRATPLARRLASERGIDLARLTGTGPGGAIVEADVPSGPGGAAAPEPAGAATPGAGTAETGAGEARAGAGAATTGAGEAKAGSAPDRAARRREIIAAAMARSKREIPHYYLSTRLELDGAIAWLEAHNRDRAARDRLVLSALFMKAVARAAALFPEMNGHWVEGGFQPRHAVDLGMVVSLRSGGIVVPTFHDVDHRSVEQLMGDLRDVVGRSRAGRLRSSELGDASITVTSLGDDGAETIFGVVYPPQVAIVGFGGIHHELHVEDGLHGTRRVVTASLSADHRVSDGQRGSQFLLSIGEHLRDPERL
jgi:pyruvate dehydrogenase E2 component (dihydrolipoamide acetyltransferase)